jgi:D-alanyl-lipoteichoic acid acyltransferase DltB (MBOAT superfamily)
MLTMLLGGLWHGASWNFVLWGFLHGAVLVLHRAYSDLRKAANPTYRPASGQWSQLLAIVAMQWWVLLTWIAFRVTDFDDMLVAMRKFILFDFDFAIASLGLGLASFFSTLVLMAGFAALHLASSRVGNLDRCLAKIGWLPACLVAALAGSAAVLLWPLTEAPFLYFQF